MAFASPSWVTYANAALARLAAGERLLWAALAVLAAALVIVWRHARQVYIRQVAAALREADARIASPQVIHEGLTATVDSVVAPTRPVMHAVIRRARGRIIELDTASPDLTDLTPGTPVRVTLATDAAALQFQGSVIDRRVGETSGILCVDRPPWLVRVQRRNFHRVAIGLPTVVSWAGAGAGSTPHCFRAEIVDISAGGIRVAAPVSIPPESTVTVRVPITDSRGIPFTARVVQCSLRSGCAAFPYVAQCEFVQISEEARQMLVTYCFEQERALYRRRNTLTLR